MNEIEPQASAIIREVLEETGLDIQDPKLVHDWGDKAYFIARVQSPTVQLNNESMGYIWVNPTIRELQAVGEIMDYRRLLEL